MRGPLTKAQCLAASLKHPSVLQRHYVTAGINNLLLPVKVEEQSLAFIQPVSRGQTRLKDPCSIKL